MKRLITVFVLMLFIVLACSKSNNVVTLKEGTPAYDLAKDLAKKLPFLDPDSNKILAWTDNFKISSGEVVKILQAHPALRPAQLKNMQAEQLKIGIKQTVTSLAEQKLLLQAAKKENISVPAAKVDSILQMQYDRFGGEDKYLERLKERHTTVDKEKEMIRNNLIITAYFDKTLYGKSEISEEDIKKAYEADKTASVRHILLMTQGKSDVEKQRIRKKMEGILARAKKGEDFAKLAQKYTEDPGSKSKGGLYEDFGRGKMVKPFEDAAFSVPVGEISDIVETRYGYHILKVVDRKKETRPYDEVRDEIEKNLKKKQKNEQRKKIPGILDEMKKQAGFGMLEI